MIDRTPERAKVRRRLIRRYRRIISDLCQLKTDKESWNDNRPEEIPFDVGKEIVLIELYRQALSKVLAWEPIPEAIAKRMTEE